MQSLPEAPRGAEAPSRPVLAADSLPAPAADDHAGADDWSLHPTPSAAWPCWTDLVRYGLGPEPAADA